MLEIYIWVILEAIEEIGFRNPRMIRYLHKYTQVKRYLISYTYRKKSPAQTFIDSSSKKQKKRKENEKKKKKSLKRKKKHSKETL